MVYEEIKNSVPEGLPKKQKKQRPIGVKSVLLFFAVVMILFAVIGSQIQYALGMVGVMITELLFLAASLVYILWKRHSLKKVFPLRKPKLSALFGTVVLWIGSYLLMAVGSMLLMAWIPDYPVSSEAETIQSFHMNGFALFFIIAVLPPICEEAMHRGVIQYGLKQRISNPWIMALVIGVIFGLFHMDPSKFFATGLLGGVMGWMMFRTDNMVYSSLFHFIHNGLQLLMMELLPGAAIVPGTLLLRFSGSSLLSAAGADLFSDSASLMISAGITTIFLGIFIPLLLYAGNFLLMKDLAPRRRTFLPKDPKQRSETKRKLLRSIGCFEAAGALTILLGFFAV